MKNRIVLSTAFIFVVGIISLFFLPAQAENYNRSSRSLPTYFGYSSHEVEELKNLSSLNTMSEEQLKKWDRQGQKWVTNRKVPYFEYVRFYTYLYGAQRDAAFLSYNTNEHFEGSLDPISLMIFKLFFSDFQKPQNYVTDSYSEKLADIVFAKFKDRFQRENTLEFQYKIEGKGGYKESVPPWIANCAKWIPWIVYPANIYMPSNPPTMEDSKAWNKEIQDLKNARKNLSDKQRQAVYFWAGLSGEGSGDWRVIANQYLFQNNVPLAKILLVRSILTMSIYDTCISYLNAKYHYSVIRPSLRDPSVKTLIAIPPHPSYPSGHSTEGTVFKMVLTYFFPDEKSHWDEIAEEAGTSRIWGGIHYPIDHVGGQTLGKMIGEQILTKLREQDYQDEKTIRNGENPVSKN